MLMPDPNATNDGIVLGQFIKDYWPLLLALIGFAVSILVVLKGKIKMEDGDFIGKSTLFDSNNQFKFQSVPMCSEIREECQMHQKVFQDNFCRSLF